MASRSLFVFSLLSLLLWACSGPSNQSVTYDLVISNGRVMDPETGMDKVTNVGILDGAIAEISTEKLRGEKVLDVSGHVVAPGFVDLHEHGMTPETYGIMVRDGVTSAFELEVGTHDVAGWYDERARGQYVNYGVSIGHIPVRMKVMGDEGDFLPSGPAIHQPANNHQILEMQEMMVLGLEAGAVAMGFGLAYTPAATTQEFAAMLEVAAQHGATSHIHLRGGIEGLREAITTSVKAGASLHIVHINSSGGSMISEFLQQVKEAQAAGYDVTTEAYPYEAGMTRIESALFDGWENWDYERIGIHQWAETGEWLNRENFGRFRTQGGGIIIHSRTEEMTLTAIASPLTMIASDGFLSNGKGHPRTSGTYSKVLGKYVRELQVLTLPEALEKMTLRPAMRLQDYVPAMGRKGRIQVGMDADITIFDPRTVQDQSTYMDPALAPAGIPYVIVGGQLVVEKGELVIDSTPGIGIRTM